MNRLSLVFVFLAALLAVSFFACQVCLADHSLEDLFIYKDKHYSAEELTLVSASDHRKFLAEAITLYDITEAQKIGVQLLPAQQRWDPVKDPGVDGYFKLQLEGLITCFVQRQVIQLYMNKHGIKPNQYYDEKSLEAAITEQARLRSGIDGLTIRLIEKNETVEQFEIDTRHIFPKWNLSNKDGAVLFQMASRNSAFKMLNFRCFPLFKDGKTAPWYHDRLAATVLKRLIKSEIESHKQAYINKIEDLYGSRIGLMILNSSGQDFKFLRILINRIANDDGSIAERGLEKINSTLDALQSPTRLVPYSSTKDLIITQYKLSPEKVSPKQFIELGKGKYLYFVQVKPTPQFKEYSSDMGNPLFGIASKEIIAPLVDEVLASLKASSGVSLPPRDILVHSMVGYDLDSGGQFGGELIPAVKFTEVKPK